MTLPQIRVMIERMCLLVAAVFVARADAAPIAYVLWHAGQSNAVGTGAANLLPADWDDPYPDIPYRYYVRTFGEPGTGYGPLDRNLAPGSTFGAEITLARTFEQHVSEPVYAGKTARNATGLNQYWKPGKVMYDILLSEMSAMKAQVEADGYDPRFIFFWTQSSADARCTVCAPLYYENLVDLAAGVRANIGQPDMPFIQTTHHSAALDKDGGGPIVNQAKADFTALSPNNYLVNADVLSLSDDLVHYAGGSFITMGYLYADVALHHLDPTYSPNVGQTELDAVLLNWGNNGTGPADGDHNGNGSVEQGDLDLVLRRWGLRNAVWIEGDLNNSGGVEQGDLDLILTNWGRDTSAAGVPSAWINDLPDGVIDQNELDRLLMNWGDALAPTSAGTGLPEPTIGCAMVAVIALGRRESRETVIRAA